MFFIEMVLCFFYVFLEKIFFDKKVLTFLDVEKYLDEFNEN